MRWSAILLALASVSVGTAFATTYVVNPNGTGDFPTIQAAIDFASDGDIIELTDGTFTGDGNRDIDFLGKAITLRSQSGDAESCVIDCQGSLGDPHRGLRFDSGEGPLSVVSRITITRGYAEGDYPEGCGAGVFCFADASPTLEGCVFLENRSLDGDGGGVFARNSSPSLANCTFRNNSARTGGGMICAYSLAELENCEFQNNDAGYGGGLICCWPPGPTVRRCTFQGNSAGFGGAVYT